jgi:DUF1707 SHOCT-like domain
MIDLEEFHDRSGQALSARTRRELRANTSDLSADDAPATQDSVVELRGTSSSSSAPGAGSWPASSSCTSRRGPPNATSPRRRSATPVTGIELDISGGSVEIRLPDGASVSTDGIQAIRSSIEYHRKDPPPAGHPHFVITGTIQRGSLELRGPRPRPLRKR